MIVVDTNVLVYLLLRGPRTEKAEILRRQERQWAAPPLWRSEFRHVLTGYLRRDLLDLSRAVALMEEAERILAPHEERVSTEHVLQQLSVPLVTEDRAILVAFPDLAQSLDQAIF